MKNKWIKILTITLVSIFFSVSITSAQATYIPLAPIPTIGITESTPVLGDYLEKMFRGGIILVGILAIVMITFGGIQYMTTDAVFQKSEGKQRITAALGGLILALSSWIILNTINSDLINSDINIDVATGNGAPLGSPGGASGQQGSTGDSGTAGQGGDGGTGQVGTGNLSDIKVTTFGGMRDIRTDPNGYALDRQGRGGAVYETDQFGSVWRYALDANGNRIQVPVNRTGFVGWDETGSVSGQPLRNLNPDTDYYFAYPLEQNQIPGLDVYSNTGSANQALRGRLIEVTANGRTVRGTIIDRGAANGNTLDGSDAVWNYLGVPNGGIGHLDQIRLVDGGEPGPVQ